MMMFFLLGFLAGQPQSAGTLSGWRTIRHTDPMSDEKRVALAVRAVNGPASVHVGCSSDGVPQMYFAVPKALHVNAAPFGEFRFDKTEAVAFSLMDVTVKSVVDELGVSATDAVFRVGTVDETKKQDPIAMLRTASKLTYNLSLLKTSGNGAAGTFNVSGFERAATVFSKVCPLPPAR